MNLFGDAVHNFVDGLLIAVSYLVSIPVGIATTIAVIFHEIPQEIGDFGILLHSGLSRARVIGYNLLSSGGALAGGTLVLLFGARIEAFAPILIALVAGNFLYLAAVDLIPSTHHHENTSRHREAFHVAVFIFGAALMWIISKTLHG